MNSETSELASLKLLSDMQAELRDALNALGGMHGDGLLEHYLFNTAAHINRAVEGYVYLRESGRVEASKHLIRTAIEAFIRLQCIRRQPELLFRIALTEFKRGEKEQGRHGFGYNKLTGAWNQAFGNTGALR